MMRKFVLPSDPILTKTATPLSVSEIGTPVIVKIIDEMKDVAYGEQQERTKPVLVGLAAPQIGISKRIVLVDVRANGKGDVGDVRVYINPEIIVSSTEKEEWYEGCYSTDRVCGIVSRPTNVTIRALTIAGETTQETYHGYTARIFQHEIDHLNGKEFITHITDDDKLHWVEEADFPEYRNNEAWRVWKKKCPRVKWEKIKRGEDTNA